MVPLFVIYAHKPAAANAQGLGVRELFTTDPEAKNIAACRKCPIG